MFKFKAAQSQHLTIFDESYGYGYCLLGECQNIPCVGILDYGLSRYTINAIAEQLEKEEVVENASIEDIPPAQRALVYTNRTGAIGKIHEALTQEGFSGTLGGKKFAKRTMFLPPSQMPCTGVYHLQEAVERTYRQRVNTMLHCSKTVGEVYTCAHYNTTKDKSPFTIVRVRLSERAFNPQAVTMVMQEWFEKLFPDNLLVKIFCEGRELEFGFFTSPSIIENILLEHPVFPADKIDGYQVVTFEFNTPITEAWVGLLRDKFLRAGAGISCVKESGNDITMEIPCAYDAGGVNGRAFESRFRFIERVLEEEHEPQRAVLVERRGLRVVEGYVGHHVGLYSSPPQPVGYTQKVLSVHESKLPLLFSMSVEAPDSLLEVTEYAKAKKARREQYVGQNVGAERKWKEAIKRFKKEAGYKGLFRRVAITTPGKQGKFGCQPIYQWVSDAVWQGKKGPPGTTIYPEQMPKTIKYKGNLNAYKDECANWKKAYYGVKGLEKKRDDELERIKKAYDRDIVALRKKHSIKDSYLPPTQLHRLEEMTYDAREKAQRKAYQKAYTLLREKKFRVLDAAERTLWAENNNDKTKEPSEVSWENYMVSCNNRLQAIYREHQAIIKKYEVPNNTNFDFMNPDLVYSPELLMGLNDKFYIEAHYYVESSNSPTQLQGLEEMTYPTAYKKEKEQLEDAHRRKVLALEKNVIKEQKVGRAGSEPTAASWADYLSQMKKLIRATFRKHQALVQKHKISVPAFFDYAGGGSSAYSSDWYTIKKGKLSFESFKTPTQLQGLEEVFLPCREGNFLSAVKQESQIDIYQGVFAGHTMQPKIVEDYYPTLVSYGTEGIPG